MRSVFHCIYEIWKVFHVVITAVVQGKGQWLRRMFRPLGFISVCRKTGKNISLVECASTWRVTGIRDAISSSKVMLMMFMTLRLVEKWLYFSMAMWSRRSEFRMYCENGKSWTVIVQFTIHVQPGAMKLVLWHHWMYGIDSFVITWWLVNQCNWMAILIDYILITLDRLTIVHTHALRIGMIPSDPEVSKCNQSTWQSNCTGFHDHHVMRNSSIQVHPVTPEK